MPRKLAKACNRHLNTYHLIRKTIYIAQHDPFWQVHPILYDIRNHRHASISHPLITTAPPTDWIDAIATIAKYANKEAKKITTKYTKDCILKVVSKYRQMYEKIPPKINRKVFKNTDTSPLDSIIDRQNNILTNPEDIAAEIYTQQSISNRPTVPTVKTYTHHTARVESSNIHGMI